MMMYKDISIFLDLQDLHNNSLNPIAVFWDSTLLFLPPVLGLSVQAFVHYTVKNPEDSHLGGCFIVGVEV